MLAYALSSGNDHWLAFTFPSLIGKLEAEIASITALGKADEDLNSDYSKWKLERIGHLKFLITVLTPPVRPQGFLPGYQYNLGTCHLSTAYSSESPHCCQERVCEHNTVLGIVCEVHGNHDFSVNCLQGACKEKPNWKPDEPKSKNPA